MTIQEAIAFFEEELSGGKCSAACVQCNANEMALAALRKQAAMQLISDGNDEADWVRCTCCGEILGTNEDAYNSFYENHWEPVYCHKCGQALKWD